MGKLIGTAGHVDHGKTSLIRALTGIDADRLPEEKSRGMTIDLGFAYLDLPDVGRVSIVDVPGHERFLANMLVGAMGVDVALLCVAADAGVMPQTREHLAILDLLPVERLVVALTRADLVDEELASLVVEEIGELVQATRFGSVPIVAVSSVTGAGVEALRRELGQALASCVAAKEGPWYLPVDRVFTVKGFGTVVTGTLMQGQVREGEEAILMPAGRTTKVRSIQSHDEGVKELEFGHRTALNLQGVALEDVERGMIVGEPGAAFATGRFDAEIRWLTVPKHGMRVRVNVGADEVMAKVFVNKDNPSMAQFRLERQSAVALGQSVIVRRYSPPDLLGGGKVLVPQAVSPRKGESVLAATGEGSEEERLLALVGQEPAGLPTERLCQALGRTPQQLGDVFEKLKRQGALLGFAGWWISPDGLQASVARLHEALLALHEGAPMAPGLAKEQVAKRARLPWTGKPLDRLVSHLAEQGSLKLNGALIAHPSFKVQINPRQEELLKRVEAELDQRGYASPNAFELGNALGVPKQAVEQILEVGVHAGRLVRVPPDLFFTLHQMDRLRAEARQMPKGFTAAEFRDRIQASRKVVIPLLEWWDGQRFTKRLGDQRVVTE